MCDTSIHPVSLSCQLVFSALASWQTGMATEPRCARWNSSPLTSYVCNTGTYIWVVILGLLFSQWRKRDILRLSSILPALEICIRTPVGAYYSPTLRFILWKLREFRGSFAYTLAVFNMGLSLKSCKNYKTKIRLLTAILKSKIFWNICIFLLTPPAVVKYASNLQLQHLKS